MKRFSRILLISAKSLVCLISLGILAAALFMLLSERFGPSGEGFYRKLADYCGRIDLSYYGNYGRRASVARSYNGVNDLVKAEFPDDTEAKIVSDVIVEVWDSFDKAAVSQKHDKFITKFVYRLRRLKDGSSAEQQAEKIRKTLELVKQEIYPPVQEQKETDTLM